MTTGTYPPAAKTDGSRLLVGGKAAAAPLRDSAALAEQLVARIVERVPTCGRPPGAELREEMTRAARLCVDMTAAELDGQPRDILLGQLGAAAEQWARDGVPIDAIHHGVHEGCRALAEILTGALSPDGSAPDQRTAHQIGHRLVGLLDRVSSTLSRAYLAEMRTDARRQHDAAHSMTRALITGRANSTVARQSGIEIADRYTVLATVFAPGPEDGRRHTDRRQAMGPGLARMRDELAACCGPTALSRLGVDNSTILLPEPVRHRLDDLIERLSAAAGRALTATMVQATPEQIPKAVEDANELLDMLRHMGCAPGLYRFADHALEFQLTRPGPGRRKLAAALAPLEGTDLLDTLERHLRHNGNRRTTARDLYVHENTVTNRLHRIGELTGFDPLDPAGTWYLRSAVLARQAELHSPARHSGAAGAAARAGGHRPGTPVGDTPGI
jgi:hypothetical protein